MAAKTKTVTPEDKCVICKKNKPHSRGACQSCLREMRTLVRIGQVKPSKRESLLLPKKPLGRKPRSSGALAKLVKAS